MSSQLNFGTKSYNPDVLSCLANLSNDEVFTSPQLANKVLDLLPEEIWVDSSVTFLDVFPGAWIREFRCLRVDARRRTTTHGVPPRYFSGYTKTRPGLFRG